MSALFCDPQDPMSGIADIEAVLTLLVAIAHIGFSPEAEHGRRFLAEITIASVQVVARHVGGAS